MKKAIVLLALSFSTLTAFAQAEDVCKKFVTCGTFEGPTVQHNEKGQAVSKNLEVTTVAAVSSNQAVINMAIGTGHDTETWHLMMNFKEDGSFVIPMKDNGSGGIYAVGVCKDQVCTYGMIPFTSQYGLTANSGSLIFSKGKLKRYMLVITPKGLSTETSDLSEK